MCLKCCINCVIPLLGIYQGSHPSTDSSLYFFFLTSASSGVSTGGVDGDGDWGLGEALEEDGGVEGGRSYWGGWRGTGLLAGGRTISGWVIDLLGGRGS